MNRDITIGDKIIGDKHLPFVIAEMSANHNQSLERALAIVDEAAKTGAHAIKLQTYTADTMTVKGAYKISDKNSLWNGRELYDLYQEAYTPWEWHEPIFNRAKEKGLIAFSSPFDESAVEFLHSLNVPAFKIASFENTDWPLLEKVASTEKPIIMSTGVASLADIDEAMHVLRSNGAQDIILLKCTSTYPASPENTNLLTIPDMGRTFDCHIGLSDHTMGIGVAVASVALGAKVIEKHFTLDRQEGGVDSAFSIEPDELTNLVIESERAFLGLGKVQYGVQASEEKSRIFKRSIYVIKDIKKGECFTTDNLKVIRPGDGLPPKYFDKILGKKAIQDFKSGTPLKWESI